MKKLFSALLFAPFVGFAQQAEIDLENKKFHLTVSAGVSVPVGNFGMYDEAYHQHKQDLNPYSSVVNDFSFSGEAKTGLNIQIDGGFKIGKIFGVATRVYSGIYKSEEKTLSAIFPEEDYYETNSVSDYNYSGKNWKTFGFLFGPMIEFNIKKSTLTTKALVGFQRTDSPQTNLSFQDNSTFFGSSYTFIYKEEKNNSTNFAFAISQELRYKISSKVCLLLGLNFTTAKAEFTNDLETIVQDGQNFEYEETIKSNFEKHTSTVSLNAGVGIVL